uniref:ABC transporter domain-containing protein n=1 Tax=Syphacia muris TaxID=451379 RepID=A0A0N5ACR4_9BILA
SFCVLLFAPYFPEIVEAHSAAKSVFAIIDSKPITGDHEKGIKPEITGKLRFKDVSFSYPQRKNRHVMENMNFEAKPGQTIALVGESGCGKSTAISLIERYYDVDSGTLLFDDLDLRKIGLKYLRTQVALVGQEPRLFAGTIRENICLGLDEDISTEKINGALEIANAKSFKIIETLDLQGLDTEVGEKGTQLSGGQKQRIAIARAVIRNPKILLLDEATSALDSEAEKLVQVALDAASEGRTCITIAHRLSSIQNANLILFIENGKVQESGTHSSLMSRKGKYYELIKRQDLNS